MRRSLGEVRREGFEKSSIYANALKISKASSEYMKRLTF